MPSRIHRFLALDSLRGICACLVALFHLQSTSSLTTNVFVRNSWVFVDFFFVLSGFVIACGYRDRLRDGYPVGNFLWLRFFRLYPLHLFVMMVFLAFELTKPYLNHLGVMTTPTFSSPREISQFFYSLLMIHIFGLDSQIVWNGPSWSIAAEFWAYVTMAFIIKALPMRVFITPLIVCGFSLIVLRFDGSTFLERTYSMGLVRCLYGFSLGMIFFGIFESVYAFGRRGLIVGTILELVCCCACIAFVIVLPRGPMMLLAPVIFASTVLVFAFEAGMISRILKLRLLTFLGAISYSIYMVHIFVESRFLDILIASSRHLDTSFASVEFRDERMIKVLGSPTQSPLSDLLVIVTLLVVIFCAWGTFRLVEEPARKWSRRKLNDTKK